MSRTRPSIAGGLGRLTGKAGVVLVTIRPRRLQPRHWSRHRQHRGRSGGGAGRRGADRRPAEAGSPEHGHGGAVAARHQVRRRDRFAVGHFRGRRRSLPRRRVRPSGDGLSRPAKRRDEGACSRSGPRTGDRAPAGCRQRRSDCRSRPADRCGRTAGDPVGHCWRARVPSPKPCAVLLARTRLRWPAPIRLPASSRATGSTASAGASACSTTSRRIACLDEADVVVTIGFDPVEYDPGLWNAGPQAQAGPYRLHQADYDQCYRPDVELMGDSAATLACAVGRF